MRYRAQVLMQTEDPDNDIDPKTFGFAESMLCDSIEEAADEAAGQVQNGIFETAPNPPVPGTCHMCGHTQREGQS